MTNPTISALQSQWRNPNDVLSVLLIIGGEIVRTALAQTSGGIFTPVCFSFGWVSYSFTALISVIGEGRLLPPPDYPVKVFNLNSGYYRENKNWVIGRLLRDNEGRISKHYPLLDNALRISIYEALPNGSPNQFQGFAPGSLSIATAGLVVMLVQLVVAAIPLILHQEWAIFLITAAGTLLALITGALPQWKAEKLPARQKSWKNVALTSGNGSRDIMIIIGAGECLDLEELCAAETPRSPRPWEKFTEFSRRAKTVDSTKDELGNKLAQRAVLWSKFPAGFWLTRVVCATQSVFWLALLVTVAGLRTDTWYLLAVGGIGMFQNAIIAAIDRSPETRDIPLRLMECITTKKVMDGLMDLEDGYREYGSMGSHLLHEFFPGKLHEEEVAWWKGYREEYEKKRFKERLTRGVPRAIVPRYKTLAGLNRGFSSISNTIKDSNPELGQESGMPSKTEITEKRFPADSRSVTGQSHSDGDPKDLEKALQKKPVLDGPKSEAPKNDIAEPPSDQVARPQSASSAIDWASERRPISGPPRRTLLLNEGIFDSPRTSILEDEAETSEAVTRHQHPAVKPITGYYNAPNPGERSISPTRTYSKVRSPDWA